MTISEMIREIEAGGGDRPDVLSMTFFCMECKNLIYWTPHTGVECPFCTAELFTEDGEINGY